MGLHLFIFFPVKVSRPSKYSRVWYINVLSYHNMNDTSLIFVLIFFSLVHGYKHRFLLRMNCPEMTSEDILTWVYMYLPENV